MVNIKRLDWTTKLLFKGYSLFVVNPHAGCRYSRYVLLSLDGTTTWNQLRGPGLQVEGSCGLWQKLWLKNYINHTGPTKMSRRSNRFTSWKWLLSARELVWPLFCIPTPHQNNTCTLQSDKHKKSISEHE